MELGNAAQSGRDGMPRRAAEPGADNLRSEVAETPGGEYGPGSMTAAEILAAIGEDPDENDEEDEGDQPFGEEAEGEELALLLELVQGELLRRGGPSSRG